MDKGLMFLLILAVLAIVSTALYFYNYFYNTAFHEEVEDYFTRALLSMGEFKEKATDWLEENIYQKMRELLFKSWGASEVEVPEK